MFVYAFFSLFVTVFAFSLCTVSKDVRLPINFQRSMAVEAEAVREARAKVIIMTKAMINITSTADSTCSLEH